MVCPTCKGQKPIISGLQAEPEFEDLVVLRVDFDARKDVVRSSRTVAGLWIAIGA